MTTTYVKEELIAALRNTFIGDSKTLKDTADYLAEASKQPGFCMGMMEIVDDNTLQVEVKQAALIQLKNNVKLRWQAKKEDISPAEKEAIKNALLLAVIRCNRNHKLIKIYKEIFTIIIGIEYRTWMPVVAIIERIGQDQDIVPLLHVLLAIAASFEFSITEEERTNFFEFLKVSLPALLELVTRHSDSEIIFLCIKFLWKSVHYEISHEIKTLACGWMPLLHAVISATNPQFDEHPDEIQTRETSEFYYFHSKKWATRIFLRFIQKHAKATSYNKKEDNKPFSDHWYTTYGTHLISALIGQFTINTVRKVRYFQLKCLQTLVSQRAQAVKQYAQAFQYDVLLKFLKLQPEDEQLAQRQPVEFLTKQDEPSINFTNLKRVATDAWVGFAELGSKPEKKGQGYQPGPFFYQNMNHLQSKLEGQNPIEKQLAMYLICQLRTPITRCKHVKNMLPNLIGKYVIPEFKNSIMFLRARAVDIFTQYGSMELDVEVVRQAVQGIYTCLTKDEYPLVRIKAATAFNCILKHKAAKDLVRPLLKDILSVYLQLLQHYDLENIVNSLESIVEDFATEIAPFAFDLVHHLGKLFYKLFSKDVEQANQQEYDGEAELAAAGCLKTITRIVESPIPQEAVTQLQPEIISLLEFIFGQQGADYIEDSLLLLNSYLFKVQKMSGAIWFYFQVTIYNMVGIPKEMWNGLEKVPLQEKQKVILRNVRSGDSSQMMEQSMPVLRNYIQKASQLTDAAHQPLKNNLISLLFYLIAEIYKKGSNEFSGELDITCCTALLIYLLQNYQKSLPEPVYIHIYEISSLNILKFKSKMLRILNSQLLALLIWAAPTQVLSHAHSKTMLATMLKEVISYEPKYEMEHQRARVILGLNTLLGLPEKPVEILQKMPEIFKTNLKLVRKNAQERIQDDPNGGNEGYEDEDEDESKMEQYLFESDEDDFWEEQYDDNYASAMDSIDEIANFKTTITKLAAEQEVLYSQLVQTVSSEELQSLDEKVSKALQKIENLAKVPQ